MMDLIVKGSIEELCAHRARALELCRQAAELIDSANAAMKRALDGTEFYGLRGHEWNALGCGRPDEFAEDVRRKFDQQFWRHLLRHTRLADILDAQARAEFERDLEKSPPVASIENIEATLSTLAAQAGSLVKRGIVNLFHSLSPEFRRHDAYRFTGKLVIRAALCKQEGAGRGMRWWNTYGYGRDRMIDLERALHVIDGRAPPEHGAAIDRRISAIWHERDELETDMLSVRWFKNGNLHVFVRRPETIERINSILAEHSGLADGSRHKRAA